MVNLKLIQEHEYSFGQGIHDGVMLANHKKYQSLGFQFVDPKWLANIVVCLGFVCSTDNTNTSVVSLFEDTILSCTGHELDTVMSIMVSDHAAIGASTAAGIADQEGCDMHDGNKVEQAAIGQLICMKDNIETNEGASEPIPQRSTNHEGCQGHCISLHL